MAIIRNQVGAKKQFFVRAQDLPNSLADVVSEDCYLRSLFIINDGPGYADVTVLDKQSPTPKVLVHADSLPRGGMISLSDSEGIYMEGGVTWSSNNPGVIGRMQGYTG